MDTEVDYKSLVTRKSQKSAELETKEFSALLSIKSIDERRRRITAIASTGDVDRYDEIILPEAFRESLPVFMKNPVVLASHQNKLADGTSPVVANVVVASITSAGLKVILEFHTVTRLAEEYWQLYSQKKQRALSVGFKPIEGNFEIHGGRSIFVHKKLELLEISLVSIPANPNALSRSKQRKQDFIAEKIARRQREKDAESFAELILTDDLSALGVPEAVDDEFKLFGEADSGPEPDYAEMVTANCFLQIGVCKDLGLEIRRIIQTDYSDHCIC